jgi:hypothetical protein
MKILTLEMSDNIYNALYQRATIEGRAIEAIALEWLAAHVTPLNPPLSEAESQAAWDRLRRHAGTVDLGHSTGADNEEIDADLAHEYGHPHDNTHG